MIVPAVIYKGSHPIGLEVKPSQMGSVQPTERPSFKLNQSRGTTEVETGSDIWHHASNLFHTRLQFGKFRK